MERRTRIIIFIGLILGMVIAAILFIQETLTFNERPSLSITYPTSTLVSNSLAEPCSWNTTLRGGTQWDFYEFISPSLTSNIIKFYQDMNMKCETSSQPETDVVCWKDYGDSVSYFIYIKDLSSDLKQSSRLTVEARWAC